MTSTIFLKRVVPHKTRKKYILHTLVEKPHSVTG